MWDWILELLGGGKQGGRADQQMTNTAQTAAQGQAAQAQAAPQQSNQFLQSDAGKLLMSMVGNGQQHRPQQQQPAQMPLWF